jgi:hypothetical protein
LEAYIKPSIDQWIIDNTSQSDWTDVESESEWDEDDISDVSSGSEESYIIINIEDLITD